ncbi:aminotransferase class V-fold PLP-dependent enzyme [Streptomyces sp. NPDC087425]|uniref:aminotransferase class V-fold PLP-dependent enzyme n=1 Tax=Streptomyces sp. NPDC087425 TaxID=3365787 RepID=UPI0037FE9941
MNSACSVDALRATEFPYLDATGQAYLDYTGAALPPLSLVRGQQRRLMTGVFGNPHSASPASRASTRLVAEARAAVLGLCGASPEEHVVIFTANATAAVRLVAESYPFGPATPLAFSADNHNSVLGMRCYAQRAGAPFAAVPLNDALETDEEEFTGCLDALSDRSGPGLFAYPAQSNATGIRHPLDRVATARRRGWHVLLDAAAHLPTGRLDLGAVPADFTVLSWYKITGFPTGVGALIARRDALEVLRRPWFAGGTVRASSASTAWHLPSAPPEGFEDGTLPFLALPDVTAAAAWHDAVGLPALAHHTTRLTAHLLAGLTGLRHRDGAPAIRLLGPATPVGRGPTVTFNLLSPDGTPLDERILQRAASAAGISIRTGCFCNPGTAEQSNALTPTTIRNALALGSPPDVDTYLRQLNTYTQGAIRASMGAATNTKDVDRLLSACAKVVNRPGPTPTEPRVGC